ncbi:MAG TPA: hypothetical protein EYP14_06645 [Planctomycetaceae bacterium]|nr:hypothetical protein [Planctomycetaceae bacterium]
MAKEECEVLLSPRARRAYDASRGQTREHFNFMLERVKNPLWRQGKRHSFEGTDLVVYKPGNTAQRMACIVRGTKVYVCELFPGHAEYQRVLRTKRSEDYPLSEFTPWMLAADEPEPPRSEEEAFRRLQDQRCQLEEEVNRLRLELEALHRLEKERDRLRQEVNTVRQQLEGMRNQWKLQEEATVEERRRTAAAEDEVARLKAELVAARLPWWKRLLRRR